MILGVYMSPSWANLTRNKNQRKLADFCQFSSPRGLQMIEYFFNDKVN